MEEQKTKTNEFAIASLVLGIASFIQLMNMEKQILAIIFGILALNNIKKNIELKGKKLAIAGIILGILAMTVTLILAIKYFPQLKNTSLQMQQLQQQGTK